MPEFEDNKQQIIEDLLGNAALTDGLCDEDAQSLLNWCEVQVAAFTPTAEHTLANYVQHLARCARTMSQIATHIEDGDSRDCIQRRLRQLTDDSAQQADFLRLLDSPRPTQDDPPSAVPHCSRTITSISNEMKGYKHAQATHHICSYRLSHVLDIDLFRDGHCAVHMV